MENYTSQTGYERKRKDLRHRINNIDFRLVEVGIHLRANETVVLDLRDVDPALRRRFIDVSAGLVYGMEGHMARGTDERYVLRPPGIAP